MTRLIGGPSNLTRQRTAKILVVDEPNVLSVLDSLLSAVHQCNTTSAGEAREYLSTEEFGTVAAKA